MSSTGDSSDDFFNSFTSPPTQTAQLRTRKPPPPPGANNKTTTKPYSSKRANPPPPPPPPGRKPSAMSSSSAARPPTKAAYTPRTPTTMPSTSSAAATSYYGNSAVGSKPPVSKSTAASTVPSSYYGASTAPSAPSNNDWKYPTAASDTTNGGPNTAPTIMNPYMLNINGNHTASSTTATTTASFAATPAPASAGLEGAMDGGKAASPTAAPAAVFGGNPYLSGPMDNANAPQPTTFVPKASDNNHRGPAPMNFDDEPPLLEELGINLEHIAAKTRAVVLPFQRFGGNMDATVIQDADLAGPIALALLLGGELLLSAKMQFGAIYGFGLFGCLAMTLILNLMSPQDAISVWTVTSILGYALLPVNVLALLKLFLVNIGRLETMGRILGLVTVLWSTVASTRLMEQGCGMRDQRYLIAYPIALLYSAFVMITIF